MAKIDIKSASSDPSPPSGPEVAGEAMGWADLYQQDVAIWPALSSKNLQFSG